MKYSLLYSFTSGKKKIEFNNICKLIERKLQMKCYVRYFNGSIRLNK